MDTDGSVLPSIENVTSPLGVKVPEPAVTVAVNVTEPPTFEGFAEEASVVVEPGGFTRWINVVNTAARSER